MNRIKKLVAVILSVLTISGVCVFGGGISAGASGTGAGLAEWALSAYYGGWSYVWGGSSPGAVDCSGLIYSYAGGARINLMNYCQESGSVSAGIPRVHGLGLYMTDHYGVYVGDGMAVDARNESSGVCYQSVASNYMGWLYWFKVGGVSYPTSGWEEFNGDYYYYEDGQYIVNTSRTIDGITYYFDGSGRSGQTPSDTSSGSSSGSVSSGSGSSSSGSKPTSWSNGSSGDEVVKIQNRLAELGFYTGPVDGSFGDSTEKAYRAFQEAAGVYVDGIAGSDREVLYSDDAPYASVTTEEKTEEENEKSDEAAREETTVPEEEAEKAAVEAVEGDFSDEVADIQSRLSELGYFGIEATGYFGEYTTQAIAAFQRENGLDATGVLDEATIELLYSEDAVANPNEPAVFEDAQYSSEVTKSVGPSRIVSGITPSNLILSNETNQSYADTASEVVEKTNKVTERALEKSSSVIPSVATTKVKRSANIWLWFVITAFVLGITAFVLLRHDRKNSRYAKYVAKKKKNSTKAQLNARW